MNLSNVLVTRADKVIYLDGENIVRFLTIPSLKKGFCGRR